MDYLPLREIFFFIFQIGRDLVNAEACRGVFLNSSTSQYRMVLLYCTSGCCGTYRYQHCCSMYQNTGQLSGGEIFGISFGAISGAIVFFGGIICICKLCVLPNFRQNRPPVNSGQVEMNNIGSSADIAVISRPDNLPKYEDLPPSYEEAISGAINYSFIGDQTTRTQETHSTESGIS